MSIVTGTGDNGETGLLGGQRVPKDHVRLRAYGEVDELGALIALARGHSLPAEVDAELECINHWLFDLGSDLANPDLASKSSATPQLSPDHTDTLHRWVEREEALLPPLREFILPGGTVGAASLHHARTVCRRAERSVASLLQSCGDGKAGLVFLNRLSDLLFVYARHANLDADVADVAWQKGRTGVR